MKMNVPGQLDRVVIGATGINAIVQQVQIVCATRAGDLPMNRRFGVNTDFIDMPLPVAQAKATASIIKGVETFVPGVRVLKVTWQPNESVSQGTLIPIVRIAIDE